MIQAIHAAAVTAVILSGLVVFLCIEGWSAGRPEEKATSTLDRSRQTGRESASACPRQTSPLIQQAEIFALYLNPPRAQTASLPPNVNLGVLKPNEPAGTPQGQATMTAAVQPSSISPKFELHGISYYRSSPDRSMALILEHGGTRRWVRQGDPLGHLVVERIDRDGLVYREGDEIRTMALASSEAVAQFAQEVAKEDAPEKSPDVPVTSTPAPPAVRGMRQIPLSRVAAKLGRSPAEVQTLDGKRMETE